MQSQPSRAALGGATPQGVSPSLTLTPTARKPSLTWVRLLEPLLQILEEVDVLVMALEHNGIIERLHDDRIHVLLRQIVRELVLEPSIERVELWGGGGRLRCVVASAHRLAGDDRVPAFTRIQVAHADVVQQLIQIAADKIVYVSCNSATQARDLAILDPLYKVTRIQAVDMFPQTHHVENVVLLEKR